jgi:hypothetical protein
MKAIRTQDAQCRNPLFSHAERKAAIAAGNAYETPEFLTLKAGEPVDCPDAWRLVVKGVALPDDAECAKRVLEHLGSEGRQAIVADIKLLQQADKGHELSAKDKKQLAAMEKAYAVELGLIESHKGLRAKAEQLATPVDITETTP